jgi:hypothetical protein
MSLPLVRHFSFNPRRYSYVSWRAISRKSQFDLIESTIAQMLPDLQKAMGDIGQYLGDSVPTNVQEDWSDVDISVRFSRVIEAKSDKIHLSITHASGQNISQSYWLPSHLPSKHLGLITKKSP